MSATEPDAKNDTQPWQRLVWPGVLVALVPAIGYYLAYAYESGIANAYGYPTDLINLQPTSIFAAAAALLAELLVIYNMAYIVHAVWPRPVGVLTSYFAGPLTAVGITAIIVLIYGRHWQRWIWLAGFVLLVVCLPFVLWPLIFQRQHHGWREKVAAQQQGRAGVPNLSRTLFGVQGPLAMFVVAVIVSVIVANALGDAAALNRRDYLVMDDGNNQDALLRVYGQQAIFAPIDRQHHSLQQSVIVVQLAPGKNLTLRWEQIGPLNLEASDQHR